LSTSCAQQGRTQGEGFGVKTPLELDILQKLYYKASVQGLIFTKITGVCVENNAYSVNKLGLKT